MSTTRTVWTVARGSDTAEPDLRPATILCVVVLGASYEGSTVVVEEDGRR
jgi:hypothetical protein